jgi:hypothetical protein
MLALFPEGIDAKCAQMHLRAASGHSYSGPGPELQA